ncbi:cohesin domain-containing protein, partial [Paenibacillus sepulcri]|nr:cohesin domain-containing protein [Paenibacillus sepulcri]
MNLKWPPILLSIVMILLYGLQPSAAMAAQSPSFKLAFSTSAPTVGQSVTVTVTGSNLSDVYGYEVNFVYDKKVLMFKSAKSTAKGFSVSPTPKEDRIVFAHTKTGEVAGDSGSIELCTLTFEVLAEGDASVKLTDVKLVDSKL